MDKWDEIRTAYAVARHGTVRGAAEELGLHRATVVRHIDTLEDALGGKLFQRHGRGYTPTEAGQDLMHVAGATQEQFEHLAGRTRGRATSVSGEIIVTSLELLAPFLMPAVRAFRDAHPQTRVRFEASERNYRLEYGEAHVAVRVGPKPKQLDNVVQHFFSMTSTLYAHTSYIAKHGLPQAPGDYHDHAFIQDLRSPVRLWGDKLFPKSRVVFFGSSDRVTLGAMRAGVGVGFYPTIYADHDPELVRICPPDPEWSMSTWLVTHVDLHRTVKVQAILGQLRTLSPS
ncbi:MAG: LysR family transcriptional regulator [Myxococcota bacterium]